MVASVTGRYFAMDRDKRWQRTVKFIDVVAAGQSDYHAQDALRAIKMPITGRKPTNSSLLHVWEAIQG